MRNDLEIQKSVEVQVGSGENHEIFVIDQLLLCEASKYCRDRFALDSKHKKKIVILNDFEPQVFDIFWQWTTKPAPISAYDPDGMPQEPWLSNAATTWLLGEKLRCSAAFDRYVLSQFIQNCAFMAFGPWELIEKGASGSSLRLFSDHWVAWNHKLAGSGFNEYSGLRAARSTRTPPDTDPRTYDIEHWYSDCGRRMRPKCLHDPITRLEKSEEAQRQIATPPPTWGRLKELYLPATERFR